MMPPDKPDLFASDPAFLAAFEEALGLQDGGRLDREAFAGRHPNHAAAVFRQLDMMQALIEPADSPLPAPGVVGASGISPRRLGDFQLIEEIGRGGMGVVYRARQISLDRDVAVKVLPPAFGASPGLRSRFEREAAAAARLSHPAIVKVHAFGEEDATLFLAMERVDGLSLATVLAGLKDRGRAGGPELRDLREVLGVPVGKRSSASRGFRGYVEAVAGICVVIADALQRAHDHGLVHRDVKPGNILLDRELRPHLTDFGLVRGEGTERITVSGQVLGTPGFMAPEMVRGRETDHRVDVFSLGVVLYEALLLEMPFAGDTTEQIVHSVLYHDPVPPDRKDRRIPHDLSTVVLRALEKAPDRRYPSAAAFRDDLTRFLHGDAVLASRVGPLGRLARRARRRPLAAAATLALAAVTIVLAVMTAAHLSDRAERGRRARELVEEARTHERDGRLEAALVAYREALELDPASEEARTRTDALSLAVREQRLEELRHAALAELMAAQRDPELAGPAIRRVASLDLEGGDTREVLTLRAIAAFTLKEYATALGHLEKVPGSGDSPAVQLLRGWIHAARGRKEEATRCLDRARKLRPESLEDFVLAAEQALLDRDEPGAFALLREARNRWPRSPHIPFKIGLLFKDRGHHDQAIDAFTSAIQLAPDHVLALVNRGYCLAATGNVTRARADFEAALEIQPRNAYAVHGLVNALQQQGRGDEARTVIEKALADRPGNPVLLNARGVYELRAGDPKAAERDFRAAIDAWPDHAYAYSGLVAAMLRQTRRAEALEAIDAGLARPGLQDFSRMDLLGQRALLRWRRPRLAEEDLRRALEIRRSPTFVANLALLCLNQGRMAEAVPLLSEQMAAGFQPAIARARRAWCRWNLLEVEAAAADADAAMAALEEKRALDRRPWVLDNRGFMAAAAGDLPLATRLAKRAATADARYRVTMFRWYLLAGDMESVRRELESGPVTEEPFQTFAEIWREAREGRVEAANARLQKLDVGVVLWPDPVPWTAIRWAGVPSHPDAVRAAGRQLLEGHVDLDALRALSLPEGDAVMAAERDWFLGHFLLAQGRARDALPHLQQAADSLRWSFACAEYGVALVLAGRPAEAVEAWDRVRPGWSRIETVWLAARHALRAGVPECDRWLRTPPSE